MADVEGVVSIILAKFGGYDSIVSRRRARTSLSKDHVRVAVKACGINFSDIYTWQGVYTLYNRQPPFVMGTECSGEIEEIGDEVEEYKVGDRVLCWNFQYGMWAESICISAKNCYKIPESMTYEDAAAFPINYLTAYLAIMDLGHLREGQTLYLQSAAGGVGCAATQLAKTIENVTIIGNASPSKHETVLSHGLKHCFNSRSEDIIKEIHKMYPKGVDIILSVNAGAEIGKNLQLLKPLGRFIFVGAANMLSGERKSLFQLLKVMWQTKNISPIELINENRSVCGLNLATLSEADSQCFHSSLKHLLNMYEKGILKPVIDSVWPFSQVDKAIARLIERKNIGKVILVPKEDQSVSPKEVESVSPKEVESVSPKEVESVSPKEVESVSPKEVESVSPKEVESVSSKEDESVSRNEGGDTNSIRD